MRLSGVDAIRQGSPTISGNFPLVARSVACCTVSVMIRLTRIRHSDPLYLNPDHIERLDRHHDTVVHLLNGNEYVVLESPEEIVEQITAFRARTIAAAARLAVERIGPTAADQPIDTVQAAASVMPLPTVAEED